MSIPRFALLGALVLCGCPGRTGPAEEPERDVDVGPTCEDASARGAELMTADNPGEPTDAAQLRQTCVDEKWPQAVIACVAEAATADAARGCFAYAAADEPFCMALAQLVEAGQDGTFASIRGVYDDEEEYEDEEEEEADDEDEDEAPEFPTTIGLPGAEYCSISGDGTADYNTEVMCQFIRTADPAEASEMLKAVGSALGACLAGWTRHASESGTYAAWVDPSGIEVDVIGLDIPSMFGAGRMYLVQVSIDPP